MGGYALGQISKKLARTNAVNNPSDVANYVADYLEEVMNLSKTDLQDLRAFRVNRDLARNKSLLEFDTLDDSTNLPDEFDIEKVMNLAENLKNGKRNPLRYNGEIVKMENISPKEKNFVFSKIDSDLSDFEKKQGHTSRRLYNEESKRDYLYNIQYDKNGNHTIKRYYIDDDIY